MNKLLLFLYHDSWTANKKWIHVICRGNMCSNEHFKERFQFQFGEICWCFFSVMTYVILINKTFQQTNLFFSAVCEIFNFQWVNSLKYVDFAQHTHFSLRIYANWNDTFAMMRVHSFSLSISVCLSVNLDCKNLIWNFCLDTNIFDSGGGEGGNFIMNCWLNAYTLIEYVIYLYCTDSKRIFSRITHNSQQTYSCVYVFFFI